MAIQGLRNTTSFDTPGGRRPQNYRETILMLYPNSGGVQKAPLTALTAVMKSKSTNDPVYHWFTKTLQDRRIKLAADMPATNTGTPVAGTVANITVSTTEGGGAFCVKEGDVLMVEQTNEILYVNATPSANNTISVIRGRDQVDGSNVALVDYDAAGINPWLVVIGSAFEEGSAAPDPVSFDPVELFSQCQIFRSTYGMTNTAAATHTRTGPEEAENKREALQLFGVDMERAFIFGKYKTTQRNGQPLRMTGGVMSYIPADRKWTPPSGVMTMAWLESLSENLFRYGSTEKLAFVGNTFLTAVSTMVRKSGDATFQISSKVKEYGIGGITRLTTPHGELVLKAHPLFTQMTGGTTAGTAYTSMNNAALILDMDNIVYRYLDGRDVKFEKDLQEPGVDAKHAGWIGECGLEVHHPMTHALITGVTSGAADA